MRIDWKNQRGRPKGEFVVYRAMNFDRIGEKAWAAWYVDSIEKAGAMVAYWRKHAPGEYPLSEEWVVIHRGDEVARFTTASTQGMS